MPVREAMAHHVHFANPGQPIGDAAAIMAAIDAGALPAGENDRLIGVMPARAEHSHRIIEEVTALEATPPAHLRGRET
jgi:hypothetical protein